MSSATLSKRLIHRRDIRPFSLVLLLIAVIVIGSLVQLDNKPPTVEAENVGAKITDAIAPMDHRHLVPFKQINQPGDVESEKVWQAPAPPIDPMKNPLGHQQQAKNIELDQRFQQALAMLHAKAYPEALTALDRALELSPNNPDILVNKGYALIGLQQYDQAYQAFDQASDINPAQANAYYGMAIALEHKGDLESALGGMRSYLHLSQDKPPSNLYVARARSAIWEWEAKLGRGPWGPTKGIPPGFNEEELRRNDQGVGVKIPLPETIDENGMMQYEIKYQDKFELFER